MSHGIAAAILAGGRARRLGGIDKSALTIEGTSILERLLAALRPLDVPLFAVGDRYGAGTAAGLTVVEDALPDAGPLGAIYTAIVSSPCDRTLVLACDMPFVTTTFLQHLVRVSDAADGSPIVIPRTANGYEPLCAVYPRTSAAAIRERLDRGERQAAPPAGWTRMIEVGPEELAVLDPHGLLFMNVNTPHDFAQARRQTRAATPTKLKEL